ncbi:hypothetical protein ACLKA7_004234 [Drosophila subpalustris]
MASKQSIDQQLQRMRRQFLQHDLRGDAKIGHSQLGDCLRLQGLNPSGVSIRQHIRQLCERHIERISFDEFLSICQSIQESEAVADAEQFISGLSYFDELNTGYIPAIRLRHILANCGERLTKKELDELLENRVNDQGLVNYVELVHAIIKS